MNIDIKTIEKLDNISGGDFYILKIDNFIDNINAFNRSFKKYYNNFKIGYSYKTNYIPYVCKVANKLGAYAEIVSELELEITKVAGVHPENIIYNGPAKTNGSLEYCLLNNSKINIDNLTELKDIVKITQKYPKKCFSIGIRLNFDFNDGFFSRFGFDPDSPELKKAIEIIISNTNLKIEGLHTHSTRPDKSPDIYLKKLKSLIDFSQMINKKNIKYINIGGGFFGRMDSNIKSQFDGPIPDIKDYGAIIGQAMKKYCPKEDIELIIEPGVSVTANILDYYAKVTDIKTIHGKNIALTTGSFHNIKPSGHTKNLSINIHSHFKERKRKEDVYSIVGYTCLENDYLYDGYYGCIQTNDIIQFKNVGAYTVVFKPPFIKPAPPIYLLENNDIKIIRDREKFENLFKAYR